MVAICVVILFCVSGHVTKACDVLRSIEEFKHKSGMVSLGRRRFVTRAVISVPFDA